MNQRNKAPSKISNAALLEDVHLYPDAYLKERAQRLGASSVGIFHALKRLGITRKKRPICTPKQTIRHKSASRQK